MFEPTFSELMFHDVWLFSVIQKAKLRLRSAHITADEFKGTNLMFIRINCNVTRKYRIRSSRHHIEKPSREISTGLTWKNLSNKLYCQALVNGKNIT